MTHSTIEHRRAWSGGRCTKTGYRRQRAVTYRLLGGVVLLRPTTGAPLRFCFAPSTASRFLAEQLASLERQTFKNWKLIASDDGSTDRTKSILYGFQKSCEPGKVAIADGPRVRGGRKFPVSCLCGKSRRRVLKGGRVKCTAPLEA
jgi:hypothetical protein